jgi:hypothetical protein
MKQEVIELFHSIAMHSTKVELPTILETFPNLFSWGGELKQIVVFKMIFFDTSKLSCEDNTCTVQIEDRSLLRGNLWK